MMVTFAAVPLTVWALFDRDADAETVTVTRAASQPVLVSPDPSPTSSQPPEAKAPVQSEAGLITTLAAAPPRWIATSPETITDTSDRILGLLGFAADVPAASFELSGQVSTASALSIIASRSTATAAPQIATLERLVASGLRNGQTDRDIDTAVNAAANAGRIAVPQALVTEGNRVDTAVLLDTILIRARQTLDGGPADKAATANVKTSGVETRAIQPVRETAQARFYTVQRGDSLGAISMQFYGDAEGFQTIFEANAHLLSSPDRIHAGQRLSIPDA